MEVVVFLSTFLSTLFPFTNLIKNQYTDSRIYTAEEEKKRTRSRKPEIKPTTRMLISKRRREVNAFLFCEFRAPRHMSTKLTTPRRQPCHCVRGRLIAHGTFPGHGGVSTLRTHVVVASGRTVRESSARLPCASDRTSRLQPPAHSSLSTSFLS